MLPVDSQEGCRWGGRGGGSINIQLRKVVGGEGGQSTVNLERIHKTLQGLPLAMLILGLINIQLGKVVGGEVGEGRGQSTVNLERICKDIARITSGNVDPGG